MRSLDTKHKALRLVELGLNDFEIARRLDVPRTTVRDWRKPRYVAGAMPPCPLYGDRSRGVVVEPETYAGLLGLYLGDGHITVMERAARLRLFLDAKFPVVVDESEAILRAVLPGNRIGRVVAEHGRMVVLWVYSSHLLCLFPQHGSGKKHERPIRLEPWQQELVDAAPWAFLRGCIRSDGCVFVNRTGPYEYLSYDFANLAPAILELFAATCVSVGLRPRVYAKRVRLYKRDDVARLVDRVGVKR